MSDSPELRILRALGRVAQRAGLEEAAPAPAFVGADTSRLSIPDYHRHSTDGIRFVPQILRILGRICSPTGPLKIDLPGVTKAQSHLATVFLQNSAGRQSTQGVVRKDDTRAFVTKEKRWRECDGRG